MPTAMRHRQRLHLGAGRRGVLADLAVAVYNATPLCVALLIMLSP